MVVYKERETHMPSARHKLQAALIGNLHCKISGSISWLWQRDPAISKKIVMFSNRYSSFVVYVTVALVSRVDVLMAWRPFSPRVSTTIMLPAQFSIKSANVRILSNAALVHIKVCRPYGRILPWTLSTELTKPIQITSMSSRSPCLKQLYVNEMVRYWHMKKSRHLYICVHNAHMWVLLMSSGFQRTIWLHVYHVHTMGRTCDVHIYVAFQICNTRPDM